MSTNFPRRRFVVLAAALGILILTSCTSGSSNSAGGHRLHGGTATFAMPAGLGLNWIFPLASAATSTPTNQEYLIDELWPPLYWFGAPGQVELNQAKSIAYPAKLATANGHTTATITLKPYRWSDGKPVTSRDVQFWFNILRADKAQYWDYQAGNFPDNVVAFKVNNPKTFAITFNSTLAAPWIYNELAQLVPIPQHAWDKTSNSAPIGNYDLSPSGAKQVASYLSQQSKNASTFAANPLWKTVDGPWKLQSIDANNGGGTLIRNRAYSGPVTGSIDKIQLVPFTSETAEFNQILAGHGIDYGYLPLADAPQASRLKALGYRVAPWITWGIQFDPLNLANPVTGPLVRQLYIRQAMEELIDQPAYIKDFYHGYGYPDYGPVPPEPKSAYLSALEVHNPYPYDPAKAIGLLRAHGWRIRPNGADTCQRPGSGATQCGSGITLGEKLALKTIYISGVAEISETITAVQSSFSKAGISLSLRGEPEASVISDSGPCAKASCYQFSYFGITDWLFLPFSDVPDGSVMFAPTGAFNDMSYRDPHIVTLLRNLRTGGLAAVKAYEDYLAFHLPALWFPVPPLQISVIRDTLHGATPQDPGQNYYPEDWYFTSG